MKRFGLSANLSDSSGSDSSTKSSSQGSKSGKSIPFPSLFDVFDSNSDEPASKTLRKNPYSHQFEKSSKNRKNAKNSSNNIKYRYNRGETDSNDDEKPIQNDTKLKKLSHSVHKHLITDSTDVLSTSQKAEKTVEKRKVPLAARVSTNDTTNDSAIPLRRPQNKLNLPNFNESDENSSLSSENNSKMNHFDDNFLNNNEYSDSNDEKHAQLRRNNAVKNTNAKNEKTAEKSSQKESEKASKSTKIANPPKPLSLLSQPPNKQSNAPRKRAGRINTSSSSDSDVIEPKIPPSRLRATTAPKNTALSSQANTKSTKSTKTTTNNTNNHKKITYTPTTVRYAQFNSLFAQGDALRSAPAPAAPSVRVHAPRKQAIRKVLSDSEDLSENSPNNNTYDENDLRSPKTPKNDPNKQYTNDFDDNMNDHVFNDDGDDGDDVMMMVMINDDKPSINDNHERSLKDGQQSHIKENPISLPKIDLISSQPPLIPLFNSKPQNQITNINSSQINLTLPQTLPHPHNSSQNVENYPSKSSNNAPNTLTLALNKVSQNPSKLTHSPSNLSQSPHNAFNDIPNLPSSHPHRRVPQMTPLPRTSFAPLPIPPRAPPQPLPSFPTLQRTHNPKFRSTIAFGEESAIMLRQQQQQILNQPYHSQPAPSHPIFPLNYLNNEALEKNEQNKQQLFPLSQPTEPRLNTSSLLQSSACTPSKHVISSQNTPNLHNNEGSLPNFPQQGSQSQFSQMISDDDLDSFEMEDTFDTGFFLLKPIYPSENLYKILRENIKNGEERKNEEYIYKDGDFVDYDAVFTIDQPKVTVGRALPPSIGKNGEKKPQQFNCDIIIDHPSISRHHCTLEFTQDEWVIVTNTSSGATTTVDGYKLETGQSFFLYNNSILALANQFFRVLYCSRAVANIRQKPVGYDSAVKSSFLRIASLQHQCQQLIKLDRGVTDMKTLHKQYAALKSDLDTAIVASQDAELREKMLKNKFEESEKQRIAIQDELSEIKAHVSQLDNDYSTAIQRVNEVTNQYEALFKHCNLLYADCDEYRSKYSELQQASLVQENVLADRQALCEAQYDEILMKNNEILSLNGKIGGLEAKLLEKDQRIADLEIKLAETSANMINVKELSAMDNNKNEDNQHSSPNIKKNEFSFLHDNILDSDITTNETVTNMSDFDGNTQNIKIMCLDEVSEHTSSMNKIAPITTKNSPNTHISTLKLIQITNNIQNDDKMIDLDENMCDFDPPNRTLPPIPPISPNISLSPPVELDPFQDNNTNNNNNNNVPQSNLKLQNEIEFAQFTPKKAGNGVHSSLTPQSAQQQSQSLFDTIPSSTNISDKDSNNSIEIIKTFNNDTDDHAHNNHAHNDDDDSDNDDGDNMSHFLSQRLSQAQAPSSSPSAGSSMSSVDIDYSYDDKNEAQYDKQTTKMGEIDENDQDLCVIMAREHEQQEILSKLGGNIPILSSNNWQYSAKNAVHRRTDFPQYTKFREDNFDDLRQDLGNTDKKIADDSIGVLSVLSQFLQSTQCDEQLSEQLKYDKNMTVNDNDDNNDDNNNDNNNDKINTPKITDNDQNVQHILPFIDCTPEKDSSLFTATQQNVQNHETFNQDIEDRSIIAPLLTTMNSLVEDMFYPVLVPIALENDRAVENNDENKDDENNDENAEKSLTFENHRNYTILPPPIDLSRPIHTQLECTQKELILSNFLQIIVTPDEQLSVDDIGIKAKFVGILQNMPISTGDIIENTEKPFKMGINHEILEEINQDTPENTTNHNISTVSVLDAMLAVAEIDSTLVDVTVSTVCREIAQKERRKSRLLSFENQENQNMTDLVNDNDLGENLTFSTTNELFNHSSRLSTLLSNITLYHESQRNILEISTISDENSEKSSNVQISPNRDDVDQKNILSNDHIYSTLAENLSMTSFSSILINTKLDNQVDIVEEVHFDIKNGLSTSQYSQVGQQNNLMPFDPHNSSQGSYYPLENHHQNYRNSSFSSNFSEIRNSNSLSTFTHQHDHPFGLSSLGFNFDNLPTPSPLSSPETSNISPSTQANPLATQIGEYNDNMFIYDEKLLILNENEKQIHNLDEILHQNQTVAHKMARKSILRTPGTPKTPRKSVQFNVTNHILTISPQTRMTTMNSDEDVDNLDSIGFPTDKHDDDLHDMENDKNVLNLSIIPRISLNSSIFGRDDQFRDEDKNISTDNSCVNNQNSGDISTEIVLNNDQNDGGNKNGEINYKVSNPQSCTPHKPHTPSRRYVFVPTPKQALYAPHCENWGKNNVLLNKGENCQASFHFDVSGDTENNASEEKSLKNMTNAHNTPIFDQNGGTKHKIENYLTASPLPSSYLIFHGTDLESDENIEVSRAALEKTLPFDGGNPIFYDFSADLDGAGENTIKLAKNTRDFFKKHAFNGKTPVFSRKRYIFKENDGSDESYSDYDEDHQLPKNNQDDDNVDKLIDDTTDELTEVLDDSDLTEELVEIIDNNESYYKPKSKKIVESEHIKNLDFLRDSSNKVTPGRHFARRSSIFVLKMDDFEETSDDDALIKMNENLDQNIPLFDLTKTIQIPFEQRLLMTSNMPINVTNINSSENINKALSKSPQNIQNDEFFTNFVQNGSKISKLDQKISHFSHFLKTAADNIQNHMTDILFDQLVENVGDDENIPSKNEQLTKTRQQQKTRRSSIFPGMLSLLPQKQMNENLPSLPQNESKMIDCEDFYPENNANNETKIIIATIKHPIPTQKVEKKHNNNSLLPSMMSSTQVQLSISCPQHTVKSVNPVQTQSKIEQKGSSSQKTPQTMGRISIFERTERLTATVVRANKVQYDPLAVKTPQKSQNTVNFTPNRINTQTPQKQGPTLGSIAQSPARNVPSSINITPQRPQRITLVPPPGYSTRDRNLSVKLPVSSTPKGETWLKNSHNTPKKGDNTKIFTQPPKNYENDCSINPSKLTTPRTTPTTKTLVTSTTPSWTPSKNYPINAQKNGIISTPTRFNRGTAPQNTKKIERISVFDRLFSPIQSKTRQLQTSNTQYQQKQNEVNITGQNNRPFLVKPDTPRRTNTNFGQKSGSFSRNDVLGAITQHSNVDTAMLIAPILPKGEERKESDKITKFTSNCKKIDDNEKLNEKTAFFTTNIKKSVVFAKLRASRLNIQLEEQRADPRYLESQNRHLNALYPQNITDNVSKLPIFDENDHQNGNNSPIMQKSALPDISEDLTDEERYDLGNRTPNLSIITERTEKSLKSMKKGIRQSQSSRITTTTMTISSRSSVFSLDLDENYDNTDKFIHKKAQYDDDSSIAVSRALLLKSPLLSTFSKVQNASYPSHPSKIGNLRKSVNLSEKSDLSVAEFRNGLINSVIDAVLTSAAMDYVSIMGENMVNNHKTSTYLPEATIYKPKFNDLNEEKENGMIIEEIIDEIGQKSPKMSVRQSEKSLIMLDGDQVDTKLEKEKMSKSAEILEKHENVIDLNNTGTLFALSPSKLLNTPLKTKNNARNMSRNIGEQSPKMVPDGQTLVESDFTPSKFSPIKPISHNIRPFISFNANNSIISTFTQQNERGNCDNSLNLSMDNTNIFQKPTQICDQNTEFADIFDSFAESTKNGQSSKIDKNNEILSKMDDSYLFESTHALFSLPTVSNDVIATSHSENQSVTNNENVEHNNNNNNNNDEKQILKKGRKSRNLRSCEPNLDDSLFAVFRQDTPKYHMNNRPHTRSSRRIVDSEGEWEDPADFFTLKNANIEKIEDNKNDKIASQISLKTGEDDQKASSSASFDLFVLNFDDSKNKSDKYDGIQSESNSQTSQTESSDINANKKTTSPKKKSSHRSTTTTNLIIPPSVRKSSQTVETITPRVTRSVSKKNDNDITRKNDEKLSNFPPRITRSTSKKVQNNNVTIDDDETVKMAEKFSKMSGDEGNTEETIMKEGKKLSTAHIFTPLRPVRSTRTPIKYVDHTDSDDSDIDQSKTTSKKNQSVGNQENRFISRGKSSKTPKKSQKISKDIELSNNDENLVDIDKRTFCEEPEDLPGFIKKRGRFGRWSYIPLENLDKQIIEKKSRENEIDQCDEKNTKKVQQKSKVVVENTQETVKTNDKIIFSPLPDPDDADTDEKDEKSFEIKHQKNLKNIENELYNFDGINPQLHVNHKEEIIHLAPHNIVEVFVPPIDGINEDTNSSLQTDENAKITENELSKRKKSRPNQKIVDENSEKSHMVQINQIKSTSQEQNMTTDGECLSSQIIPNPKFEIMNDTFMEKIPIRKRGRSSTKIIIENNSGNSLNSPQIPSKIDQNDPFSSFTSANKRKSRGSYIHTLQDDENGSISTQNDIESPQNTDTNQEIEALDEKLLSVPAQQSPGFDLMTQSGLRRNSRKRQKTSYYVDIDSSDNTDEFVTPDKRETENHNDNKNCEIEENNSLMKDDVHLAMDPIMSDHDDEHHTNLKKNISSFENIPKSFNLPLHNSQNQTNCRTYMQEIIQIDSQFDENDENDEKNRTNNSNSLNFDPNVSNFPQKNVTNVESNPKSSKTGTSDDFDEFNSEESEHQQSSQDSDYYPSLRDKIVLTKQRRELSILMKNNIKTNNDSNIYVDHTRLNMTLRRSITPTNDFQNVSKNKIHPLRDQNDPKDDKTRIDKNAAFFGDNSSAPLASNPLSDQDQSPVLSHNQSIPPLSSTKQSKPIQNDEISLENVTKPQSLHKKAQSCEDAALFSLDGLSPSKSPQKSLTPKSPQSTIDLNSTAYLFSLLNDSVQVGLPIASSPTPSPQHHVITPQNTDSQPPQQLQQEQSENEDDPAFYLSPAMKARPMVAAQLFSAQTPARAPTNNHPPNIIHDDDDRSLWDMSFLSSSLHHETSTSIPNNGSGFKSSDDEKMFELDLQF